METQRSRVFFCFGLCLWAACGANARAVEVRPARASAMQTQQQPRTRLTASDFPKHAGEFERREVHDFSQEGSAALGFVIGYHHPREVVVHLYVYDANKINIPDGDQSPEVREQIEKSSAEISVVESMGMVQSVERLGDKEVAIGDGQQVLKALGRSFRYIENRHEVKSYLYVTGYRKDFIKIRASYYYNPDTDAACDTAIQTFLANLGPILTR